MQIKLTVRDVTVEYDGEEEFFKAEVPIILKKMSELSGPATSSPKVMGESANEHSGTGGDQFIPKHSTNTVAKLISASTGPDLVRAAVAKIIIIDGNAVAKRGDITREMRAATSYYKRTYTNNLSAYLDTLTKADQLRLVSDGTYGLPAKARDEIEGKLHE